LERAKLLVLIYVHDTFKREAQEGVPISHERRHGALARKFAGEFTADGDLLEMIQRHDEPYALFKKYFGSGDYDFKRLADLTRAIKDWDTFCLFQIIDNATPSKLKDEAANHLSWFLDLVDQLVPLRRDYSAVFGVCSIITGDCY
jgi:hypothetical protein